MATITNSLNNDSNFLTATTGMTATTGDITATTGDIVASAGNLVTTNGNLVVTSGLIALGGSFGSSGDVLTSQGNVTAPIWAPATGGGGLTWVPVISQPVQIVKGHIYSIQLNGQLTLVIPTPVNSTVGDTFALLANGSYGNSVGFNVSSGATCNMTIGNKTSTVGTGYIESTTFGDTITFVCSYSDGATFTGWTATSVIGNITVV